MVTSARCPCLNLITIQRHLIYAFLQAENPEGNGYFGNYNYKGMLKLFGFTYVHLSVCILTMKVHRSILK